MKKTLLLSIFSLICMSVFASFPVNKENAEKAVAKIEAMEAQLTSDQEVAPINITVTAEDAISPAAAASGDNMLALVLLWFFLGGIAGHRWYAGKPIGWNILFILTLGGFGIWWLVDGINILSGNFD